MKIFGERLKELRKENNLSAKDLANALNVRDSTIIRWENNKMEATITNLYNIAKYFNVTADYLIGLED